jgi:hypothetical protein
MRAGASLPAALAMSAPDASYRSACWVQPPVIVPVIHGPFPGILRPRAQNLGAAILHLAMAT